MNQPKLASILNGFTAACFFVVSALHGSGYGWIMDLAQGAPAELMPHITALWWAFSVALAALGGLIAIHARNTAANRRALLVLAGCFPFFNAMPLLRLVGFFAPVAVLTTLGLISFVVAVVSPKAERLSRP